MHNISRRHFVRTIAGVPFLMAAAAKAFAPPQNIAFSRSQKEAIEAILHRLVDSGAVPGISYSIGNARETLAEGTLGLQVVGPRMPMEKDTRCALASVSKQFVSAACYLLQQKGALSLDEPL